MSNEISAAREGTTKPVNYTEEMVTRMVSMYQELGNEGLEKIAEALDRPVRSVRSKLVREGVYVAESKPKRANKKEGPTKKEMLRELDELVPFEVDGLMGATKEAIGYLIEYANTRQTSEEPEEEPEA